LRGIIGLETRYAATQRIDLKRLRNRFARMLDTADPKAELNIAGLAWVAFFPNREVELWWGALTCPLGNARTIVSRRDCDVYGELHPSSVSQKGTMSTGRTREKWPGAPAARGPGREALEASRRTA
jgi:hypothetical protein